MPRSCLLKEEEMSVDLKDRTREPKKCEPRKSSSECADEQHERAAKEMPEHTHRRQKFWPCAAGATSAMRHEDAAERKSQ